MDNKAGNLKRQTATRTSAARTRTTFMSFGSGNAECPRCHARVEAGSAICGECGAPLIEGKCSFCGAPMAEGKKFCTHCGSPRGGVACPECGTMNWRNFCRRCNAPLTRAAAAAVEEARHDVRTAAIRHKAEELSKLLEEIDRRRNGGGSEDAGLSTDDIALLDQYRQLIENMAPATATQPQQQAPAQQRRQYAESALSIDELLAAYRDKAAEMDAELAALTPPPAATPEQQRDFYCARMMPQKIYTKECDMSKYYPVGWKCNFCGFVHRNPSDCVRTELGGSWVSLSEEEFFEQYAVRTGSHDAIVEIK